MDNKSLPKFKAAFKALHKHPQANLVLTSFVAFLSIYIALISLFNRFLFRPLAIQNDTAPLDEWSDLDDAPFVQADMYYLDVNDTYHNESAYYDTEPTESSMSFEEDYILTIISLFILWISAQALGKVASSLYLPALLGMLIAGILFGNLPGLRNWLHINIRCGDVLRQLAFLIIIIRGSMNLDPEMLKSSIFMCSLFGFLSTTVEVLAITLASHFFFWIPIGIAIPFAYCLASTSPAVSIPAMIRLQKEERGTDKGIPTVIVTSATIDNLYSITAFYIVWATTLSSSNNGQLAYTIPRILVEILLSGIFGLLFGLVLRALPQKDANFLHFTRTSMTICMSVGLYYGTRAIQCFVAGPVIVFLMCTVASMRWKHDNVKRTKIEEHSLRVIWIFFAQPLLFGLIGLFFDFSTFTWESFGNAIAILAIGCIFRALSAFMISLATSLNVQEQSFMAFCFLPKATVQAALGPALAAFCARTQIYHEYSDQILQTCILSILITAPLGQLLILTLGRTLLYKRNVIADYHISQIGTNVSAFLKPSYGRDDAPKSTFLKPSYGREDALKSEPKKETKKQKKQNLRNIEIIHPPHIQNPPSTTQIPPPFSFTEINQQAHQIYQDQRNNYPFERKPIDGTTGPITTSERHIKL